MDPRPEVARALAETGGVLSLSARPQLAQTARWLARRGELVKLLPGTYTAPDLAGDPDVRMRAACARHRDGVLCGTAAARLSFWPDVFVPIIEVAHRSTLTPQPGYRFSERTIPPELVVEQGGFRFTDPALTAIDLATTENADAIDLALRSRMTTLDRMHEAMRLTPGRWGNVDRRAVLLDSRDEPWSGAERLAHRRLRAGGVTGWRANLPVTTKGRNYFIDLGFARLKIAVEIDGRVNRLDAASFESDRRRQNALALDGWLILRFTWLQIENDPDTFIAEVREALELRGSARLRRSRR